MDTLSGLLQGFDVALAGTNLAMCIVGVLLGTVIGVLPGLGPPATIAMLLPLTMRLEPTGAMIMLAGIYYGAKYGGSTTSILLNVPGESASVVTCLDGYQMARKGRAGAALGHQRDRVVHRRHAWGRRADADSATAREAVACVQCAGVFRADGARSCDGRSAVG